MGPGFGAQAEQRGVDHDAIQPGGQRCSPVEGVNVLMHFQQRFLQDILGLFALAHQTQGYPVQHRPMLGDELFKGGSLLALEGFHKIHLHVTPRPVTRGHMSEVSIHPASPIVYHRRQRVKEFGRGSMAWEQPRDRRGESTIHSPLTLHGPTTKDSLLPCKGARNSGTRPCSPP
jgi:hypothetical protein